MDNALPCTEAARLAALNVLYDALPDLIFFKDMNGVYLRCNQDFCDFVGRENESDIIGKTDYDLFDREQADFFCEKDAEIINENTTKRNDEWVVAPDGRETLLDTLKTPLLDTENNVIGVLGVSIDITKHYKEKTAIQASKDAQQQSLQQYRLLFDNSRDAMFIMSPPCWHYTGINQAALEMFGSASPFELTTQGPLTFSPQHQPGGGLSSEMAQEKIESAIREGSICFEWVHQKLDGSPFFADVSLTRIEVAGEILLHCSVRDIGNRKQIEHELQESEEKYRCLFDLSEDPMCLIIENRFVMANHACAQLLGYDSVETLLPLHPSELSPEYQVDGQTSHEKANAMMSLAYREGYIRFEWMHKKNNGDIFPVEVSLTRIPYEGREALFCIWRDITERNLANKELADKEAQFHSLVENIPGSTYRCRLNKQWTMLFVSNEIENLSGYPATDFIGENPVRTFAEIMHPDDRQPIWENTNKAVSEKTCYINEYRIIDKQGLTHYVHAKGKAIYSNDGSPEYLDGTIFDITERKQLEGLEKSRSDMMEIIATGDALPDVLKSICLTIERQNPDMLCSILLLDSEGKHLLIGAAPSLPDFYNAAIHGIAIGMGVGSCGTAAFTGRRVIVDNTQTHPYWAPFTELTEKAELGACWSEPICSSEGEILGTFAVYHHFPHYPTETDIVLIEQAAHLTSIAIEKYQAKLALKLSEERWAFAIEGSGDGVWDWDIQTDKTIYSKRWEEMLGYAEDEGPSNQQQWLDSLHPEDRESACKTLHAYLEGKQPKYVVKYRVRNKNAGYKWILDRGMIVSRDNDNKPLRMVGTHSDITGTKEAEDQLKLAASVFCHASEGIAIADSKGAIIDVNDTFTKITGYSREEVLGKNPRILQSGRQSPNFYAEMWATLLQKGSWAGEIWNRRKNGEVYAELLTISAIHNSTTQEINYVALFTDITEQKTHQTQLQHMAHYDVLTNLPNRVLLADRLTQAMVHATRDNRSIAVLFLDLDGFKVINDMHGHHVGDELLIAISKQLSESLRDGDTLSRIGGDEFVAVLTDIEKIQDCEPILERLLHAASSSFYVNDTELKVSASIGVTIYPQDGADADVLIRHADQAMYTAKQEGKNRYHLFDTAQDTAVKTQRESLNDIRSALNKHEFVLYYQPKVNMRTGVIIGAEALIRWQHPVLGLVPPNDFLPAIENHDLSIELGEWVISTALSQISAWKTLGLDLPVSVNISAFQLQSADFADRLAAQLAGHPEVAPRYLELEVLETSELGDTIQATKVMNACIAQGVRFALDDFGTGYSSLTYLRRLPAHLIKIDQIFIRDMLADADDLAIVEGVVALAKSFKRKVIAEGVETIEHGLALLQLGCELAQGYGIARPMPAKDLPKWVETWRPDKSWSS